MGFSRYATSQIQQHCRSTLSGHRQVVAMSTMSYSHPVCLPIPARRYASAGTSHGPVSVCVSVTGRSSIEKVKRIELGFGVGAPFDLSYTVLNENWCISKNNGTSLWNCVPNSGLRENLASVYRSSKRVIDLARERWTPRA